MKVCARCGSQSIIPDYDHQEHRSYEKCGKCGHEKFREVEIQEFNNSLINETFNTGPSLFETLAKLDNRANMISTKDVIAKHIIIKEIAKKEETMAKSKPCVNHPDKWALSDHLCASCYREKYGEPYCPKKHYKMEPKDDGHTHKRKPITPRPEGGPPPILPKKEPTLEATVPR